MGSGCGSNKNPYGCLDPNLTSNCVKYAGDPESSLGICTNDTVTEVLEVIIDRLNNISEGTEITIDTSTFCTLVRDELTGQDTTVDNVTKAISSVLCDIQTQITALQDCCEDTESYSVACITDLGTLVSREVAIQTLINAICDLQDQLDSITEQFTNDLATTIDGRVGDFLLSNLTSAGGYGLKKTGANDTAAIKFYGFVPPLCPVFCVAELSNFDSTGKGISGGEYEGWYICTGNYGTPDMRGYGPAGATNLPGITVDASLDSRVDPVTNSDITYGANILEKKGEVKHQNTVAEMPSHVHEVNDEGHSHTAPVKVGDGVTASIAAGGTGDGYDVDIASATTGITIAAAGGGQKHENRQPTIYGYFIMRLN